MRIQPASGALGWTAALPLFAAVCSALYHVTTPLLARTEDPVNTIDFTALVAGVALAAATELETATNALAVENRRLENLHGALASRQIIGRAEGILMQREMITAGQAFDLLRRASQNLNAKVREVAQYVINTGDLPDQSRHF